MKKLFLATTAFVVLAVAAAQAADMYARRAYTLPAAPAPVYTWTGMYWGANVGYSWGESKNDRTGSLIGLGVNVQESQHVDGVIGGVQTGYNYQFGTWVFGLETDIQASGQKGGSTFPVLALTPTALTTDHKLQWFGTTRRALAFWPPPTSSCTERLVRLTGRPRTLSPSTRPASGPLRRQASMT